MEEKIGSVVLDYEYYSGENYYSDGDDIEEKLLDICKSGRREAALRESCLWPVLYHLSDIRGNILEWYPFEKDADVLEIGSGCGAVTGYLCRKAGHVVGIELSKRRALINAYRNQECKNLKIVVGNFKEINLEKKFDYVTLTGVLEYAGSYMGGERPYEEMLERAKGYLKPGGKIMIAIENKMGLKYLNGAKEDHTGRPFAGIEDYRDTDGVRTFSRPELCSLLKKVGIDNYKFYYPSPDYKLPDSLYSDAYMPQMGDIRTWGKNYDSVRVALYNEGIAFDQVCRDGKFDYFSNSFLVICNETESDIRYIHYTSTRNREYQTRTIISGAGSVEKHYLYDCDRKYDIFSAMETGFGVLREEYPNIEYLEPTVENHVLKYPYLKGRSLESVLTGKLGNVDGLIEEFKGIIRKYFCVNEEYLESFVPTDGYREFFGDRYVSAGKKALKVTNVDMLLQNLILEENRVVCIDYEWVFDFPVPAEFVIYRCAEIFYKKYQMYIMHKYNLIQFLTALGIGERDIPVYESMNRCFYNVTDGDGRLDNYRKAGGMLEIKI